MTSLRRDQHSAREARTGRYRKTASCDGRGKPVGTAWYTDDEVCDGGDGPGFYLCERARCRARLEGLSVDERRSIYERTRAESERLAGEQRRRA